MRPEYPLFPGSFCPPCMQPPHQHLQCLLSVFVLLYRAFCVCICTFAHQTLHQRLQRRLCQYLYFCTALSVSVFLLLRTNHRTNVCSACCVSICTQHTSAYVSICTQHTSAYVTNACSTCCVSICTFVPVKQASKLSTCIDSDEREEAQSGMRCV